MAPTLMERTSTRADLFACAGDAPPSDGVTHRRRETKFSIPHGDVGKIASILSVNCRPVSFNDQPISHVYSIYFDDERLSGCRENIDGISRRTKARLRWYDSAFPSETAFFEVKRRTGGMTSKDRLRLEVKAPLSEVPYRALIPTLAATLPAPYSQILGERPEPVVLVAYRRRHYVSRDGEVRITLDDGVRCFSQMGRAQPSAGRACHLEGAVILEVKAPLGAEATVRRLIHPLRLRVTKSSKYVRCCQLLGSETGTSAACLV